MSTITQPNLDIMLIHGVRTNLARRVANAARPTMFVIDGTNLLRATGDNLRCGMAVLLAVALEAIQHADDVLCIFDANTRHIVKVNREVEEIYLHLLRRHGHHFVECTGGTRADDIILAEADYSDAVVISNDRFRDFATTYSWIGNPERTLRCNRVRDHIYLGTWRRTLPVNLWKAVNAMERQLHSMHVPVRCAA